MTINEGRPSADVPGGNAFRAGIEGEESGQQFVDRLMSKPAFRDTDLAFDGQSFTFTEIVDGVSRKSSITALRFLEIKKHDGTLRKESMESYLLRKIGKKS